jgi:hypothetical protein
VLQAGCAEERIVVDELAHEHVALLRLVDGGPEEVLDEREVRRESDSEAF